MSQDRELINSIKFNFARKSKGQLEEIAYARDHERWSPEAVVAAGEVLKDRLAGRGQEPEEPESEVAPAPFYDEGELLANVLLGLLGGPILFTHYEWVEVENPDLPLPFGPKMAWLALDTTDTQAVAKAVCRRGVKEATWVDGLEAAHKGSIYITPPLADWTLVVGTPLCLTNTPDALIKPLLEELSRQFDNAQYFFTRQDLGLHIWAKAGKGKLVRGHGRVDMKGVFLERRNPDQGRARAWLPGQ